MKWFWSIIILIIILLSCKHVSITDEYIPRYTSSQLQNRLEKYFNTKSVDSIENFLNEWNKEIPPSSDEFINQNDTLKNIFKVFNELYKPYKFGDYCVETYSYPESKYIVIQSIVNYSVLSTNEYQTYLKYIAKGFPNDSTLNFYYSKSKAIELRPVLSIDSIKCLYLTYEYEAAINNFLLSDFSNGHSIKSVIVFSDDAKVYSKYEFLSSFLQLVHAHGGQGWYLETFPIVYKIVFDDKFQHGLVDFRAGFGSTVHYYGISKVNGQWKSDSNRIIRLIQE